MDHSTHTPDSNRTRRDEIAFRLERFGALYAPPRTRRGDRQHKNRRGAVIAERDFHALLPGSTLTGVQSIVPTFGTEST